MDCYLCPAFYPTIDSLLRHLQVDHGAPANSNYKCTACKPAALFKDVHRFKRHIKTRHHTLFQVSIASSQIQHEEDNQLPDVEAAPEESKTNNSAVEDQGFAANINNEENSKIAKSREQEILEIRNNLREVFLSFTINLHSKKNLSRKNVIELQQNITDDIVIPILDALSKVIDMPEDPINVELINDLRDPFNFICTEQRLNTQLGNLNMIQAPTVIHYEDEDGNTVSKGCLTPIKFQLKKFLETGSIFQQTLQNMARLEQTNGISNVVNGTLWKTVKPMYGEKSVIPFFLYSDEAELNDALGAHSGTHKVCGLYYSLPTIPSHYLSRLSCIFVAGFIKASDIAKRGPSTAESN